MQSVIVLIALVMVGCQTGVRPVSSRVVGSLDKPGSNTGPPGNGSPPEIFIRRKSITITPAEIENTSGSLLRLDDPRNELFLSRTPIVIGNYLDVKIASNRIDPAKAETAAKEKKAEGSKEKESVEPPGKEADPALQEILKAIPDLTPKEGINSPINSLKMQITQLFPNGDASVMARRSSQRDELGNEIHITAKVPGAVLVSGKDVTSNDLTDIHWQESGRGEHIERFSSEWEDEYTLRLSGFDEAKSRIAMELEDKRQQLVDIRDKVTNQAKSMGDERRKIARERDEVNRKLKENTEKMAEMERQLEEQKKQLDDQKKVAEESAKKEEDSKEGKDDSADDKKDKKKDKKK